MGGYARLAEDGQAVAPKGSTDLKTGQWHGAQHDAHALE